ncbi:MAG: hypothetical protein IPG84_07480 [Betaproteobacteria bacterium]|nr:hypothetical protein [Betaproteobacteria bacterium]
MCIIDDGAKSRGSLARAASHVNRRGVERDTFEGGRRAGGKQHEVDQQIGQRRLPGDVRAAEVPLPVRVGPVRRRPVLDGVEPAGRHPREDRRERRERLRVPVRRVVHDEVDRGVAESAVAGHVDGRPVGLVDAARPKQASLSPRAEVMSEGRDVERADLEREPRFRLEQLVQQHDTSALVNADVDDAPRRAPFSRNGDRSIAGDLPGTKRSFVLSRS